VPCVSNDPITGKPYQDVKRSFASACRRAGTKAFRFHGLRQCFASHLATVRVDLTTVQELLSQKTLATLCCSQLGPSHKIRAVDLLDSTSNETKCPTSGQKKVTRQDSIP
jgi:hypothetical protein